MMRTFHFFILLISSLGLCLSGCGDFFERKPTELESRAVLRDIARIRGNPHVNNPLPSIYTDGPKRLKVEDGVKLFYFTKYMPVGDLTYVNKDPAIQKEVHGYGGMIQEMGFKVSTNPGTNQLIIHCADDAECDQVLSYLERTDVPPIQVHIDCLILERFGDVTKDWETTLLVENLLGESVTLGEDKFPNPAFPGASLRESRRSDFGLDFGYWINKGIAGHQVRGVVDVLESRGYLKILMNPTLETVNGKKATVQIRDNAPVEKTVTERNMNPYTVTDYQWVADTLTITPNVYADGSIGLKTQITIGSKSKPEGVVQTSIITERSVDVGENRIQPGKSLVIGGMRKSENRSVVRGVPFLKDIPILGILFSSKDFEEKATEIVFILTPSISEGGIPYEQMASVIRAKYATPDEESGLHDLLSDPLGSDAYSQLVEEKTQTAQTEKVKLTMQASAAKRQAQADRLRTEKALLDAQAFKSQEEQSQRHIEEAAAKKKAAEAEAEAARKELELYKAKLLNVETDLSKMQMEAEAARAEADKALQTMQEAQQKAKEADEQALKAAEESALLKQQIEALEREAAFETENVPPAATVPEPPIEGAPEISPEASQ
jgi:Flp pilus assembly secretin CpaC